MIGRQTVKLQLGFRAVKISRKLFKNNSFWSEICIFQKVSLENYKKETEEIVV